MQMRAAGRESRHARRVVIALIAVVALFAMTFASASADIAITKQTDQGSPGTFTNFASTATVSADGMSVHVAGTVDCAGPTADAVPVQIWVLVWRSGIEATGMATSQCTGQVEQWSTDVSVHGGSAITAGAAHSHAWVAVDPSAGGGPSAFDWGRMVTLAP